MNLVPFTHDQLPAYLSNPVLDVNSDLYSPALFPSMSIRGKRFTVSRDGVRTVLRKPGFPDELAQHIGLVIVRANMNTKIFYAKKYVEGDSDNVRPDCYSMDGITPSPRSQTVQAPKCSVCPHAVWGSRISDNDAPGTERKGRACADGARIAVSAPDKLDPMLLRVPPASLKNLREVAKLINQRTLPNGQALPYNAVLLKVGFDIEASSPKLTFSAVALVDAETYAGVTAMYDGEVVRAIVGADDHGTDPDFVAVPTVPADALDKALAERAAQEQEPAAPPVQAKVVTPVAPKPTPRAPAKPKPPLMDAETLAAAAPPQAPAAPAAPATSASSLLDDLDSLLGTSDD